MKYAQMETPLAIVKMYDILIETALINSIIKIFMSYLNIILWLKTINTL